MELYENGGFQFFYKNRRIGESEPIDEDDMSDIGSGKGNEDNLYIYCEKCGVHMDFVEGKNNNLDGKWVCPDCRRSVRESTPYKQLDRENSAFDIWDDDDDDDDYDLAMRCHDD